MGFNTLSFIPFLLIVILLYFTVFRKCQWIFLLIASIAFYLFAGPKYIVFIIISSLSTYFFARKIQKMHDAEDKILKEREFSSKDAKKAFKKRRTKQRRRVLVVDFIINLGLLCVIKYTDFILSGVSTILSKFGMDWSKEFNFILPLGISFYTFMLVGYILDVYWKRYRAETNYFKLALFSMYFPHIVQGPIGRYNRLAPQFFADHPFDYNRVTKGFQLILWGYFEKMVISDRIQAFTNGILANWQQLTGFPLLLGISLFSIQLYLDWMGCMDIAMVFLKYLELILIETSGIRSSQRICLSSGEDGIFHLVHGSKIIYCIRFQCQDYVRKLINSQEENGETRLREHFQQLYRQQLYGCYRCLAWCRKLLCALGRIPWNFNYNKFVI